MSTVDVAGEYGPVDGPRVEIVLVYQSLLGIYGDRGNATVLARRLAWRGFDAVLTVVEPGDPLPDTGQVYLLGGGEDAAQISAVTALICWRSSWSRRGTRMAQPLSRKCRLISPTIVGVA